MALAFSGTVWPGNSWENPLTIEKGAGLIPKWKSPARVWQWLEVSTEEEINRLKVWRVTGNFALWQGHRIEFYSPPFAADLSLCGFWLASWTLAEGCVPSRMAGGRGAEGLSLKAHLGDCGQRWRNVPQVLLSHWGFQQVPELSCWPRDWGWASGLPRAGEPQPEVISKPHWSPAPVIPLHHCPALRNPGCLFVWGNSAD